MSIKPFKPTLLRDLMTTEVATCGRDATLEKAAQIMWEHDCGCVPVVDEAQRLVGLLTDRDVCMGAYTTGENLAALPVTRVMTTDVETCGPDDTVEDALRKMERRKVRRVPVVGADGRIAGIVSMADVARRARPEPAERGHTSGVLRTLARICSPDASFEDSSRQETIHV